MSPEVVRLCEAVRDAGGRAVLVGGWVRDHLLGLESKDFDVEVYGIEPEKLRTVLERIGRVNSVGEHFSVYKLVFGPPGSASTKHPLHDSNAQERFEIDVSLPRRESKSGHGHRGFVIEGDPSMTFAEAARRRDFTINAIIYDPLADETIDPFEGSNDLESRILRVVAPDTFGEDSLRVLRAVQLAARFEMTIEPATVALCREIDLSDLPRERVWGEIEKLLMLAARPSIGLWAALDLSVLDRLFPEISSMIGQRGNADLDRIDESPFRHLANSLDKAASLAGDLSKPKRLAVMLATLCHNLGDSPSSPGERSHEPAVEPARSILERLGLHSIGGYDVHSQVLALVAKQPKPREIFEMREANNDGLIRRLSEQAEIDLLYRVAKACAASRVNGSTVPEDWFIERAQSLGVSHGPPTPLLKGRLLLELGFEPGPQMGRLLRKVYELQLDGEVTTTEEALAAARRAG
jgi:tRNA nucleotidyltransferase (CCA-adding enzyme)